MSAVPNVAAIGLGHWGKNLVRNIHALGALCAMHDTAPELRRQFTQLYPGVPVHDTLDTILDEEAIAGVVIATPASTHGALVRRALEAGKHVFVEKPLCLEVAEARELAAFARQRGQVLMVGHLLLYHPAFRALKAAFEAGRLGRLRYIYSTRLSLGKIRREENALWSFAPHDISMILQLTGALPRQVVARGGQFLYPNIADTTLSHMTFADGVQAHIFVSWIHPYKDQRLVIVGEDAMAVFNDVSPGPAKLQLYPHKARWDGEVPVVFQAEAEPIPYGTAEPLRCECEAFLAAIAGGPAPPSNAEEGIAVLRVLGACQAAIASERPVELAP